MILDGYWNRELKHIRRNLLFWSRVGLKRISNYPEHEINKCFLYSAAIMRKIFEDEKEAEVDLRKIGAILPPLEILKIRVKIIRYDHISEEKFFMNSRVFLSDYDTKNAIEDQLSLFAACNQIIHSYAWEPIYSKDQIYGVLLASDREKEKDILLLTVKEWTSVIEDVIEKSTID